MGPWLFLHFNRNYSQNRLFLAFVLKLYFLFTDLIYALAAVIIASLVGSVIIFGAIIRKLTISHRKYDGYHPIRMDNISEKLVTGNLFDNLLSEDDEDLDKV